MHLAGFREGWVCITVSGSVDMLQWSLVSVYLVAFLMTQVTTGKPNGRRPKQRQG